MLIVKRFSESIIELLSKIVDGLSCSLIIGWVQFGRFIFHQIVDQDLGIDTSY